LLLKKVIGNSRMQLSRLAWRKDPMKKNKDTTFFENKLLQFITEDDPLMAMLQWVADKLVEVEVAQKVNSQKGKHSRERTTY